MNDYYWDRLAERARDFLARPEPHLPDSVPSPCMSLCLMHPSGGWCEGCLRTLPEIGNWGRATDEEKRQVWAQIPDRLRQLKSTPR
jgi:predicted Fe-S protein YdhL (DUF1289 family)